MLTRLDTGKYSYERPSEQSVRIGDVEFGQIFPWRLEYNCPVHENWNIVHTGMLIPESHQIYVCSDNCLRGVVLTADEMGAMDRISSVMPTENEVVTGKLEDVTIKGVIDVINRLKKRPKAVELFLVCMHHQIGVDERYIYDSLRREFPDIVFIPCYMDPIMQKVSLTPEQKERKSMMLSLEALPKESDTAGILGDNLKLPLTSDISRILKAYEINHIEQVQDKTTFEEYKAIGRSSLYITRSALSVYGLEALAKRDGRKYIYLPPVALDDEIEEELRSLINILLDENFSSGKSEGVLKNKQKNEASFNITAFLDTEKSLTKEAFRNVKNVIGDTEITLDYLIFPRPLSFARRLLSEGFNVTTVFLDGISPEEKVDFEFLKQNHKDLILHSTNHVLARHLKKGEGDVIENAHKAGASESLETDSSTRKILALGPKAAFFSETEYFVNWIENDGNFGFDGLRKLCDEMIRSFNVPKDRRDIVQRKGLHNPSCV